MKISCLLHYHEAVYDPQTAPSNEELEQVKADPEAKIVWEGWGYYYALDKLTFHVERPYYFKLKKELNICKDPTAIEQA